MHACDNICQTGELTYNVGHAKACPHLWKFAAWRFICRELTVPCGLKTLSQYLLNEWTWSLVPLLPAGKFSVRKGTAKQTFLWHFLGILEGFLGSPKMLAWALKGKGLDTVHRNSLLCHPLFVIWFHLILTKWINIELAKKFIQVFPYHHILHLS